MKRSKTGSKKASWLYAVGMFVFELTIMVGVNKCVWAADEDDEASSDLLLVEADDDSDVFTAKSKTFGTCDATLTTSAKQTVDKGTVGTITVTLAGTDCTVLGQEVTTKLSKASKKRITLTDDALETDDDGVAEFGFTASSTKAGTAKVTFKAENDDGEKLKKTAKVKVSK